MTHLTLSSDVAAVAPAATPSADALGCIYAPSQVAASEAPASRTLRLTQRVLQ